MRLFFKFFITAIFISSVSGLYAQNNLGHTLSNLSGDAANGYLGPAVSGLGADMNSNWFHEIVQPKTISLDVELSFAGMGTFFTNSNKTFNSTGQFRFNYDQWVTLTSSITNPANKSEITGPNGLIDRQLVTQKFQVGISGPTVVGSKNQDVIITFPGKTFTFDQTQFVVPKQTISLNVNGYLNNLSILPAAVPQLSIGTLLGTSLTLRYLSGLKINSNLDAVTYFGVGIQHNPALWLNISMPVDLSIGLAAQNLKVGSVLNASGESASLNVAKTFGFDLFSVSPYISAAVEKSTVKVNYTATYNNTIGYENDNISFDENGANSVSLTLGTNLRLGLVNLNIDYTISHYNTLSAGLGFIIF